jgi:uncharacterized membrane protein HdeD (DUF308 family)
MATETQRAALALKEAVRASIRRFRYIHLLQAGLMIAAGAVALLAPYLAGIGLVVLLGWLLILAGAAQAISLIGTQDVPHFWMQLVSALLGIVVGLLFLVAPTEGLVSLTLLLIVFLMIDGVAKVVLALTIRPVPNWGWILAGGALGILLAIILWTSMPATAAWLLGLLLGINLVAQGIAHGAMALAITRL